jgi:3-dehydroquinate synthase
LGERSYPIHLGDDLLPQAGELLRSAGCGEKICIVTDPQVAQLYLEEAEKALARSGFAPISVILPGGEERKNLESVASIYDRLIDARFERGSCLMALGGGVVGDIAGFAAATYLRGIDYVQFPSTLLAQVDSSVGGKTGVNHREGKNLIGAFYQPRLVAADTGLLRTLPRRELLAGLAEVIKYGVIEDRELFHWLEEHLEGLLDLDGELLVDAVSASCRIKSSVVEKDERESDYRAVLNFGHTIGHALEAVTDYRQFLHGEAVAIGMAKAAAISKSEGFCDEESFRRIVELLKRSGLPSEIPAAVEAADLVKSMELDKKSAGGKVKFVLCRGIGKTRFHWLTPAEILRRIEESG